MQKQNKPLWKKVHTKIFEDNIPQSTVCAWLNDQVDIYNASVEDPKNKLPKFNDTNFSLHLNKHIPDRDILQRELIQAVMEPEDAERSFSEGEKQEIEEIAYIGLGEQSDNYKRLSGFVESFINRLTTYNNDLNDAGSMLSVRDLTDLGNVLKSVIMAQKELTAIRNSDKLAGAAVRAAIEATLATYIPLIIDAVERLRSNLQEELGVESSLAKVFPNQIKHSLLSKEVLQKLSADVILQIFQDYKIK